MRRIACTAALVLAIPAIGDNGDILERSEIETPEGSAVKVEHVTYESDGLRVVGYLAYPSSAPQDKEKLPCIVFNRGGNRDFGAITPQRAVMMGAMISGWGYVLIASNYRGSPGSEGADEFGGRDVNDVVNAIKILDHLEFADTERIGMWGHSRGGMMTYLALKETDRIAAAVVGAGAADLQRMIKLRPAMEEEVLSECVPDWPAQRDKALATRSAVRWADQLPADTPLLLIHGTADWRVDPRDSLDMARLLLEARRPYRLIMFEGADHGLTEYRQEYFDAVRGWFDRYVRDKAALPNLEPHGR
jgi:dipeptidyl aminopeptidase/acylaminoacyl peptidase